MVESATLDQVLTITSEEILKDDHLFENLAADINALIQTDFEKLVNMLYRIDVSEAKLKEMLHTHADMDAGKIIAGLLIERQLQKIKLRREFSKNRDVADDEEKW